MSRLDDKQTTVLVINVLDAGEMYRNKVLNGFGKKGQIIMAIGQGWSNSKMARLVSRVVQGRTNYTPTAGRYRCPRFFSLTIHRQLCTCSWFTWVQDGIKMHCGMVIIQWRDALINVLLGNHGSGH